ncbi:hypothetical protein [Raineyella sp. W15-4]|uniref:hypothetical protein n=1 Tax=Raineyella sp. W15-4 TaxID=3081651 RepID=UPI0029534856|nr:hypothetical protein [Raineyella sp. W15-4]WOQ15934.1 hypothetical protein R0145_11990 [Raineyella sp. W15-4]
MIQRRLPGWSRSRDDRPAPWAVLPRPRAQRRETVIGPWALRASAFPHPSSPSSAPPARSPQRVPSPTPRPPEATGSTPQVVPLGGGLALVSVGQWDEDSASTIQMPAIRDTPSPAPGYPSPSGPSYAPRPYGSDTPWRG